MDKPFCVLYINRTDSKCGACGEGANMWEVKHDTYYGYGNKLHGCGAWFTHVGSHYKGLKEAVMADRPDLEWYDGFH